MKMKIQGDEIQNPATETNVCGTIFVTNPKQDEPETGWDCGQHRIQEGKAA